MCGCKCPQVVLGSVWLTKTLQSLNFEPDSFAPFLPPVVATLVQLTAEADSLEAKRRITDSLNTVIERAESRVRSMKLTHDRYL